MRAHIDTTSRLIQYQKPGVHGQPACQDDFLLVSTRVLAHWLVDTAGTYIQSVDIVFGQLLLFLMGNGPKPASLSLQCNDDVLLHGQVGDDAVCLAILGTESEALFDGIPSIAQRYAGSVHRDRTGVAGRDTKQDFCRLGSTGAQQSGHTDDLTFVDIQVERHDPADTTQM